MKAAARALIVAVTICSWIAISNHCALRAFAAKSETNESCPFHSKPDKSEPQRASSECCKILRGLSSTPAKNPAPAIVELVFVQLVVPTPPKISFSAETLDTGPPGKTSFGELNRSMCAHAPPELV